MAPVLLAAPSRQEIARRSFLMAEVGLTLEGLRGNIDGALDAFEERLE